MSSYTNNLDHDNNTTKTDPTMMAGKKRKAPPLSSSSSGSSSGAATTTKGVDTLLTIRGRPLAVGESVRFTLIKGPPVTEPSGDPVDSTAPLEKFPLIAKFGESVVRPIFTREPWKSARLYQQEIPKPVDDSDEENEDGDGKAPVKRKKRWRYASAESAPRQWILQENVDFLQTMIDRKEQQKQQQQQQKANGGTVLSAEEHRLINSHQNAISSRYEGIAEHNPSLYALVRLHPSTTSPQDATLQVCMLPNDRNCTVNFAQPAARKTYSLTEAEHVISDQRMGLVKSLHHMASTPGLDVTTGDGGDGKNGVHGGGDGASSDPPVVAQPRPNILALRKKAAQSSKGRLLDKLKATSKMSSAGNEEEDGDDVMADVAFKSRKGGGMARKELLQTMGEGVTVSDEGVLGGSNDVMFGGRQRFAQLAAGSSANDDGGNRRGGGDNEDGPDATAADADAADGNALGGGTQQERGADGAAMDDDFYQRDVQAEYEELDYDANEQFDDDDVDLGEGEVVVDNSDNLEVSEELDEELEDEDDEDEGNQGAQGLASLAGFQALLAKARGETPPDAAAADGGGEGADGAAPQQQTTNTNTNRNSYAQSNNKKKSMDHMSKIMAAAEKSRLAAEAAQQRGGPAGGASLGMDDSQNSSSQQQQHQPEQIPAAAAIAPMAATATTTAERDAHGLRIISLEAVRREIWLNHRSIPMKRLMKIFNVGKKSPKERQDHFRDILKELCIMKADPINGRMLVLKQHYAK
ncbi:hypothetical protein ACA910_015686 [Epithemia clementina (nom. ined.)]